MDKIQNKLEKEIKRKKELKNISDDIIFEQINKYIISKKVNENFDYSEKDIKIFVKELRLILRDIHGRFQISGKNRMKLLENMKYDSILKTHLSTLERMGFYKDINEIIKKLNIKSILDIACGLNPIALANKDIEYDCFDINKDEINLIKKYFKINNIKGNVTCEDALNKDYSNKKYDLCIIMKFLDFIENGNKVTKYLLYKIDARYFLISFATKSISGKSRTRRRIWFERILDKENLYYELKEFDNEIFYIVKKK
jgi:2-polyprenyl-3-methyl-5-hydroxy-6-metoxy-1,4-benzoquinol methylase